MNRLEEEKLIKNVVEINYRKDLIIILIETLFPNQALNLSPTYINY